MVEGEDRQEVKEEEREWKEVQQQEGEGRKEEETWSNQVRSASD